MIIIETSLDYEKQCKFEFGIYYQAGYKNYPTNEMGERMTVSFILCNAMKLQGGYIVVIINTVNPLTIRNNMIHELPLPEYSIDRVEQLSYK